MRRAVVASLSISLRPITPRGSRSRFMEERLALPLFFCRSSSSSSIFVIAAPGTAVNADKLRPDASPHFPRTDIHKTTSPHPSSTDGIYELLFHQRSFPLSDDDLLGRQIRSLLSRRDEHAPIGRWRIDVHACRNEASCPEREWRIIDCSKDHRLVCRIQPCGSQLEVYVHLLKSGLPMSHPPLRDWARKYSFGGRKWKTWFLLILGSSRPRSLINTSFEEEGEKERRKSAWRTRPPGSLTNERTKERRRRDYTG